MSVQIHCDNCDDSLETLGFGLRPVGHLEHVVITVGPRDDFGGEFAGNRRDFCDHNCLSKWAKKQDA